MYISNKNALQPPWELQRTSFAMKISDAKRLMYRQSA